MRRSVDRYHSTRRCSNAHRTLVDRASGVDPLNCRLLLPLRQIRIELASDTLNNLFCLLLVFSIKTGRIGENKGLQPDWAIFISDLAHQSTIREGFIPSRPPHRPKPTLPESSMLGSKVSESGKVNLRDFHKASSKEEGATHRACAHMGWIRRLRSRLQRLDERAQCRVNVAVIHIGIKIHIALGTNTITNLDAADVQQIPAVTFGNL